jgi:hypothetical protein
LLVLFFWVRLRWSDVRMAWLSGSRRAGGV